MLRDAGHIIGSAMVQLFIKDKEDYKTVVFSGDLGQWDVPIIEDPTFINRADYVFIETTYGDRLHDKPEPRKESLYRHIKMFMQKEVNSLSRALHFERTQELLYTLSELINGKMIFPIWMFIWTALLQ